MLIVQPKSVLKSRKSEFDGYLDDDEILNSESAEDSFHPNNTESVAETNVSVIACIGNHIRCVYVLVIPLKSFSLLYPISQISNKIYIQGIFTIHTCMKVRQANQILCKHGLLFK